MTPLHAFGDLLRSILHGVPLWAVRGLFVGSLVVLLVWVLTLPESAVTPPGGVRRRGENLRLGAGLAIVLQIVIYCLM